MISRRQFLNQMGKFLIAGSVVSIVGAGSVHITQAQESPLPSFAVPPSIMLHSDYHHRRLLPDLITALRAEGYEGITYRQFLAHTTEGAPLPEKPVIISVDDMTMARGVPAYYAFRRFYQVFKKYKFAAVFAINTMPHIPQDISHWKEVSSWVADGRIEFATHTATHYNLNDANIEEMRIEICESAQMIMNYTGQTVKTLVLPFGSGYDIANCTLRSEIVTVCKEAGIRFAVGIAGGRNPVCCDRHDSVVLMGRVGPGMKRGEETIDSAMWEVQHWIG